MGKENLVRVAKHKKGSKKRIASNLRKKLWRDIKKDALNGLTEYLGSNDVGEEDPILVVDWLPHLDAVSMSCGPEIHTTMPY
jgi:hypothetical protein